jgi:hypothetical protein
MPRQKKPPVAREDEAETMPPAEDEAPAAPPPGPPRPASGAPRAGAPRASLPPVPKSADPFVRNGLKLIYNQKALPQLLQSLDGNGNPAAGLAVTLVSVLQRLMDSAEQNGAALEPQVVLNGAAELIERMAELSAESGGHAYSDQEKQNALKVMLGIDPAQEGPPEAGAPPEAGPPGAPPSGGGLMPQEA